MKSYLYSVLVILVLFIFNFSFAKSANILAISPSPGFSQYILIQPLLIALARKGHNVTAISAFGTKNVTNLKNIVVNIKGDFGMDTIFQLQDLSIFKNIMIIHKFGVGITEQMLKDAKVQDLINSDEKFDLVLVETFYNEAQQVFAAHFNAHQVLFHSMAISEWNSHMVANPNIPSYLPSTFSGYTTDMTFFQRLRNSLSLWFDMLYKHYIYFPEHQKLVNKYFTRQYNLNEIIYNASLMLACSHVSSSEAMPLTTAVVEVGGLHITQNPLSSKVKEFLESAKDGAIFFSLGSNIHSSTLSKQTIKGIVDTFGSLRQKVLWKFEADYLTNLPKNVMISKWFSQSDILAHPNTILFISHCGMGSTTEAIYSGVPVIGIPVFADQFMNIQRLIKFGMGIELPFKELTGKNLKKAIHTVSTSSKYKENAKRRSNIAKDRPMKPLDEAVYWIEYVLRHDGAHHLRNSIFNLPWYKLYGIDVAGFILALIFLPLFGLLTLVHICKRKYKSKNKQE